MAYGSQAVVRINKNGTIYSASSNLDAVANRSIDLIGKPWASIVDENETSALPEHALRHGQTRIVKLNLGDSPLWVETISHQIENDNVAIIIRRINRESVFTSDDRSVFLGEMLNSLEATIFVKDLEGRYVYANKRNCDFFRLPLDEIIGRTVVELVGEDLRDTVHNHDIDVLRNGQPTVRHSHFRIHGTDQTSLTCLTPGLWKGTPLLFGVSMNTSVLTKEQREIQALYVAAAAADRAKSEFLANMGHEFRTPLHAITTLAEAITLDEGAGPSVRLHAETQMETAAALSGMIDHILRSARAEDKSILTNPRPTDLEHLVRSTIDIQRPMATAKGLTLSFEYDRDLHSTYSCDRQLIRQILLNLVGNAIKFTPTGSIEVVVSQEPGTFRCGSIPTPELCDHVRFAVTDTGAGIAKRAQERLFKRFSRIDDTRAAPHRGTGLGLAICKDLVNKMAGEISVDSEPGTGSTFYFILPLGRCSPSTETPTHRAKLPPGLKILLADDSTTAKLMATNIATSQQCSIDTAGNGAEAVMMAKQAEYDVILMDIHMPVMDGLEATRAIRRLPGRQGKIPVVGLTANDDPDLIASYRSAGMNGCIMKPIRKTNLIETILDAIETEGDTSQAKQATGQVDTPPVGGPVNEPPPAR